jgi:hypothetical protein
MLCGHCIVQFCTNDRYKKNTLAVAAMERRCCSVACYCPQLATSRYCPLARLLRVRRTARLNEVDAADLEDALLQADAWMGIQVDPHDLNLPQATPEPITEGGRLADGPLDAVVCCLFSLFLGIVLCAWVIVIGLMFAPALIQVVPSPAWANPSGSAAPGLCALGFAYASIIQVNVTEAFVCPLALPGASNDNETCAACAVVGPNHPQWRNAFPSSCSGPLFASPGNVSDDVNSSNTGSGTVTRCIWKQQCTSHYDIGALHAHSTSSNNVIGTVPHYSDNYLDNVQKAAPGGAVTLEMDPSSPNATNNTRLVCPSTCYSTVSYTFVEVALPPLTLSANITFGDPTVCRGVQATVPATGTSTAIPLQFPATSQWCGPKFISNELQEGTNGTSRSNTVACIFQTNLEVGYIAHDSSRSANSSSTIWLADVKIVWPDPPGELIDFQDLCAIQATLAIVPGFLVFTALFGITCYLRKVAAACVIAAKRHVSKVRGMIWRSGWYRRSPMIAYYVSVRQNATTGITGSGTTASDSGPLSIHDVNNICYGRMNRVPFTGWALRPWQSCKRTRAQALTNSLDSEFCTPQQPQAAMTLRDTELTPLLHAWQQ